MATIKVGGNQPTSSPVDIPGTEVGSYGADAVTDVAQGVEAFVEARQSKILGQLAAEAQDVVSATAGFEAVKNSIVENMQGTDRETFLRLSKDLSRVRSGELQGVMSPASANLRLQFLAKSYINRYPRMAAEIRKMLAAVSGDITPETPTQNISDPVLKKKHAIVEEAVQRGWAPIEVVALHNAEGERDAVKAKLEKAEYEGRLLAPEIMEELMYKQATVSFGIRVSEMRSRISNGTFNKENELAVTQTTLGEGIVKLHKELSAFEREKGVIINHDSYIAQLTKTFEPLIALIPHVDSQDKAKRLADIQQDLLKIKDWEWMRKFFGPLTGVVINNPETGWKIASELSEMAKRIEKGELVHIEMAAKGDPKTAMLYAMLKEGSGYEEFLKGMEANLKGDKAPSLGSEAMDRLRSSVMLQAAVRPGTPGEEAANLLTMYIHSGNPIDGVLKNTRTHSILQKSPDAQAALEQQTVDKMTSVVSELPLNVLTEIEIDMNSDTPFKYPPLALPIPSGKTDLVNPYQEATNTAAHALNDYYKAQLIYKNPWDAQADVVAVFEQLVENKVQLEAEAIASYGSKGGPESRNGKPGNEKQKSGASTSSGKQDQGTQAPVTYFDGKGNKMDVDLEGGKVIYNGVELAPDHKFTPEQLELLPPFLRPAE